MHTCIHWLSPRNHFADNSRATMSLKHRLNMELDLQSPKFTWAPCAQLYSLAEPPQLPPSPAFGLIYEGAIGQPRRQTTSLCEPCFKGSVSSFVFLVWSFFYLLVRIGKNQSQQSPGPNRKQKMLVKKLILMSLSA